MRIPAFCVVGAVWLVCGCSTSRYRIVMSGLGSEPNGVVNQKFCLFPCEKNEDGTFRRVSDDEYKIVRKEAAKYPDIFSDDGEVVRVRWLYAYNYKDGNYSKDLTFEGPVAAWNLLAAFSICTLPMFSETEFAYRVILEFESKRLQQLEVAGRSYDFVGYDQHNISLVPLVGWLFPYPAPSDTPFYRRGFSYMQENARENRAVGWQAIVARAAVELRRASQEIDVRLRDAERRKKSADAKKDVTHQPVSPHKVPAAPVKPQLPSKAETITLEDIPL